MPRIDGVEAKNKPRNTYGYKQQTRRSICMYIVKVVVL